MGLAPVIAFDTASRTAMARRLQAWGVPTAQITATRTDTQLADLYRRERTLRSIERLTGHDRAILDHHSTDELVEIERCTTQRLMGATKLDENRLIYSLAGRRTTRRQLRRAELDAWDLPA